MTTALGCLSGVDPSGNLREGEAARLSIRPEDMRLLPNGVTAENAVTGRVVLLTFQGTAFEGELATAGDVIQCHFDRGSRIGRGDEVTMGSKAIGPWLCGTNRLTSKGLSDPHRGVDDDFLFLLRAPRAVQ